MFKRKRNDNEGNDNDSDSDSETDLVNVENNKIMFYVKMNGQEGITFSDMTLHDTNGPYAVGGDNYTWTQGVALDYGVWDFKINNIKFEGFGYAGVSCNEYTGSDPEVTWWKQRGVIWDCDFIDCRRPGLGYGVSTNGGQAKNWAVGETLGLGGPSSQLSR